MNNKARRGKRKGRETTRRSRKIQRALLASMEGEGGTRPQKIHEVGGWGLQGKALEQPYENMDGRLI